MDNLQLILPEQTFDIAGYQLRIVREGIDNMVVHFRGEEHLLLRILFIEDVGLSNDAWLAGKVELLPLLG